MSTVRDRLILFIEHKGLSKNKFEKICGLSTSYVSNISQSIQPKMVQKISHNFPELNTGWLLTGEGDMLKTEPEKNEREGIPLLPNEAFAGYGAYQYSDLPVEEFYTIREFRNANFMLRVSGDSMAPKFNGGDLVSRHTARRTAATNMYKSGVPAYNIMLITGHTSEATFRRYIKFEKERNAELMRDNPYFKKRKY